MMKWLVVLQDMMLFLNWTRVAILYEDEYGLIRLQELVRSPPTKNIEIYIRQTNPANYRTVLREIKNKEIFNIIVDTNKEHIQLFFRTLLQLQMNNNKVGKKGLRSSSRFDIFLVPLHFHLFWHWDARPGGL